MERELTGRVALVTGSSRGIGRAVAEHLAGRGATVVINSRNGEEAAAVAAEIGGEAVGIGADISTDAGANDLFARLIEQLGRVDILVNNAGRSLVKPSLETTFEDWHAVLETNLTATFLCAREAAVHMLAGAGAGAGGVIINVSSIQAKNGLPGRAAYSSSKAGVEALTRVLAAEWAPKIRVNAIVPGYVRTEIVDGLISQGSVSLESIEGDTPLGRLAEPSDVAGAVGYLVSDSAAYVAGALLAVDGGWLAGR